jgi:hypothetical protein
MSASKVNPPIPAAADIQWSTEPPTKPGTYWFRRDPPSRDIMAQVRETNGERTVWWPTIDQPVAELRASWRGPKTRKPVTNGRDDCLLNAMFTADQAKTVKQLLFDVTEDHP